MSVLHVSPYIVSLVFFALTFLACELCRQIILKFNIAPNQRVYLLEFLGTLQVCTTVYENGLVLKHYGVLGFFVSVFSLVFVHGLINRGANVVPCVTVENWLYNRASTAVTLTLLAAELIAAYFAFGLVRNIWKLSALLSLDHTANLAYFKCVLPFKVPLYLVCAYEFGGCFLIRTIVGATAPSRKRYAASFCTATLLSVNVLYIGAAALNPIIATARFAGCEGLSHANHLIIHWICAMAGWLIAAQVQTARQITPVKRD